MTITFSSEPHFDDFSEDKKFHKILFKPGYSVQARELNQLQSILQNQISRHGDHTFKEGAMVIPGQISFDNEIFYVKLKDKNASNLTSNQVIDKFLNKIVVGQTSGVKAQVIHVEKAQGGDPATLFVRYVESGVDNLSNELIPQYKTFISEEVISYQDSTALTFDASLDLSVAISTDGSHTGKGSLVSIEEGIYYTHGYFVKVDKQSLVLEKYETTPTSRVGLKVDHLIITSDQDESLLDNAQNTPNYAAPGGDRYKIDLTLQSRDLDSEDDKNFIELIRVESGVVKKEIRSTEYAVLEATLARRTFDESGNYVVKDFKLDVREHRNNDRGTWELLKTYIIGDVVVHPTTGVKLVSKKDHQALAEAELTNATYWSEESKPFYNRGIYKPEDGGDDSKLAIAVEPGKAYVLGYEIEKIATEYVEIPKARNTSSVDEGVVSYSMGSYVLVDDFDAGNLSLTSELRLLDASNEIVGTARLISMEFNSSTSVKLFLREFKINAGKYLQNVKRVSMGDDLTSANARVVDKFNNNSFELNEPTSSTLIFPLPYYAVNSVVSGETNYSVRKTFSTGAISSGTITIDTGGAGVFASDEDDTNYLVLDRGTGEIVVPTGIIGDGTSTVNIEVPNNSAGYYVIATIVRNGIIKRKELTTSEDDIESQADAILQTVKLSKVDGYRLKSVKMSSTGDWISGTPTYDIDITDRYEFDDGQRDSVYDYASIVLKPTQPVPTNKIRVEYEYFHRVDAGDYFSVNSYIHSSSGVDYKSIPYYKNIALRDCLDFRQDVTEAIPVVPKRGEEIFVDFEYFLPRKTKLAMDSSGKIIAKDGESSLNPPDVAEIPLTMTLANIELNAYTFDTSENNVIIEKVDNRRYTMRDIGKLEKRIENLEYYTSLSLLEQETQNLDVVDSNGDSRYKNGFIVDSFNGHGVGDTESVDYRCSIDMENGILRPFFSMKNVNLVQAVQKTSTTLKMYGDLMMLPIEKHVPFIKQPYGSRTENVNPFAVYTFLGTLQSNPSGDEWFETERKPDIINNVDGNFNTIKSIAEEAGVLGTVWNSWQTSWAGTPRIVERSNVGGIIQEGEVSQSTINKKFGRGADTRPAKFQNSSAHGRRFITLETVATNVGQSRNGIKTSLSTKIDKEVVSDKVVNTSIIPYIRSRSILIKAVGLKPNTRYFAFFDDVPVTGIIEPTNVQIIKYTPINNREFDSTTNVAGNSKVEKERQIGNEVSVCLNVGDVIRSVSGDTAIVVGKHVSGGSYYLRVANIKKGVTATAFDAGVAFTGSISGATGTVLTVTPMDRLLSNEFGEMELIFRIPNTESMRFRTGSREFKLVDTKDGNNTTSKGSVLYRANGIVETKQATVNAVRNAELVKEAVNESRSIVQRSERVASDTGWYDPLAQTFLVESKGGAFLTKVDLFFSSKDDSLPVTVEIREVVNGYPGKTVLPFSRVVKASRDVKISSSTVSLNGESVAKYDTPTSFEFSSPVYVNDGQEYCVVVLSDSNKYKVWISQMGDVIPGGSRTISEQPYAGVLFKSQNASTWTADQYQDLMFTLYKAAFKTNSTEIVTFVNDDLETQVLDNNPFQCKSGTSYIRVHQRDHGFKAGDTVNFSNVSEDFAGIDKTIFMSKTYVVRENAQLDSYVIAIGDAGVPNKSGNLGGSGIRANRNIKYSAIQPNIQIQEFPETTMDCAVLQTVPANGFPEASYTQVLMNDSNILLDERIIYGNKDTSINVKCSMRTSNSNVSPIIDTHRTSLILVNNKINNPTEENTNDAVFDNGSEFFVDDSKNASSTYSCYVTRAIKLLQESSMINVRLAANIPSGADIIVYRRSMISDDVSGIINRDWVEVPNITPKTKVQIGNQNFIDMSFADELDSENFNIIQVKIVMKSINPAIVPSIKDLRVIALA